MKPLVFCTCCLEAQPGRLRDWVSYYTRLLPDVDLLAVNDGPPQDVPGVTVIGFPERLGRKSVWRFPGWKRSFHAGLAYAADRAHVAHVESDLYIRSHAIPKFLAQLTGTGYATGFTAVYNFPETALQVVNDPVARTYLTDRYAVTENWDEEIDFESMVKDTLKPHYFMVGERIEGRPERYQPGFDYLAGTTLAQLTEIAGG